MTWVGSPQPGPPDGQRGQRGANLISRGGNAMQTTARASAPQAQEAGTRETSNPQLWARRTAPPENWEPPQRLVAAEQTQRRHRRMRSAAPRAQTGACSLNRPGGRSHRHLSGRECHRITWPGAADRRHTSTYTQIKSRGPIPACARPQWWGPGWGAWGGCPCVRPANLRPFLCACSASSRHFSNLEGNGFPTMLPLTVWAGE